MFNRMKQHRPHYDTLGVKQDASQDEIKKAFRAKAKGCHPDHHPGDHQKENAFKNLSIAYGVLGDPDSRKQYDETGDAPPINDIMSEAYGLIIRTFQNLRKAEGDNVLYMDPLDRMKSLFEQGKNEAQAHIDKLKNWNKRNDKLIKKICRKDGGQNSFFHIALAEEKRQNEQEMEKAGHAIKVMEKSCEVLDEFKFTPDKRKEEVFDHRRMFGFDPAGTASFQTIFGTGNKG